MERIYIDPVIIQVTPSIKQLKDVVSMSVCELYSWATIVKYKWNGDGFPTLVISLSADISEIHIKPETIRKGMQLALTPGVCNQKNYDDAISYLLNKDFPLNNSLAMHILQLGIFGMVRYVTWD